MKRTRAYLGLALGFGAALWLISLPGCSATAPANGGSQVSGAELHFSLNQCQSLGPDLWKCPAIDKPICSPNYVGTDVQCVRVDKTGGIVVQQMQM